MNRKHCTKNLNPNKPMLAFHFLSALGRINKNTSTASSYQRSCIIKRAAYASMAHTAGPRRAWSRALLYRLRRGSSRLHALPAIRRTRSFRHKRVQVASPKLREPSQADVLRRLVPGGEAMELSSLLKETAHYIQSLSAQVWLMQNVVGSIAS